MIYPLVFLVLGLVAAQSPSPQVSTIYGPVTGFHTGKSYAFTGIPYAQPPIGSLRFKPSVPPTPWTSPLAANYIPNGCIQACELPTGGCPITQSEDCLYLNVYVPTQVLDNHQNVPVLAFIHGGNYRQGYSNSPLYDGQYIANQTGNVVVTLNYRLGAFGFFVNENIDGNAGITDQRNALQWVQDNIKYFGGDPNQVTISGQSAGGKSIAWHLVSKASFGLYSKAIVQSDCIGVSLRYAFEGILISQNLASLMNCGFNDLNCLQSVDSATVLAAQLQSAKNTSNEKHLVEKFQPWEPVVGLPAYDVDAQLIEYFQSGNFNRVPFILGTVSEEAVPFIWSGFGPNSISILEVDVLLTALFGLSSIAPISATYPFNVTGDNHAQMSLVGTDYIFECSGKNLTYLASTFNPNPVWYYRFDHVASFGEQGWGPDMPFCWDKVCHGADLPFFFGSFDSLSLSPTQAERDISAQMINYFGNFVKTGNPNNGVAVPINWPVYDSNRNNIHWTLDSTIETEVNQHKCEMWNSIGFVH